VDNIYNKIIELQRAGQDAILCTVVSTKGSTPLKEGAKMLVMDAGTTYGTVGGGKVEKVTIEQAQKCLKTYSAELIKIDLLSTEGTSCGGTVEVFLEPVNKKFRLYIFGAGHVGRALAGIVSELDFDITIIDDREGIFSDWNENSFKKITIGFEEYFDIMQFDERIFITIITYDHKIDWEILSRCSAKPWHYLGMMGSKSKVKSMKNSLAAKGISEEIIDRIDMPIGMNIQAETAFEIAVSIAANLIKEKNILSKKLCENMTG